MKFAGHTAFFYRSHLPFSLWPINSTFVCLGCSSHDHRSFFSTFILFGGVVKKELTCASCACFLFTIHFSPGKGYSYFTYHHSEHAQLDSFFCYSQEHTLQMVTAQTMHEYLVFGRRQTEQLFSIATSKERRRLLCATRYRALGWHFNLTYLRCKCFNRRNFCNACGILSCETSAFSRNIRSQR